MALVDVVLYVSICLSLCWLQLWLKGHTSLLVPHRVPHGAQHIFPTALPQPWQLTYMSSFVNFDRTCLYIYFLETHTDAFLLSSSPSVTDSVVHTMGFSLNNVWDMHWYFFCMWNCECIVHFACDTCIDTSFVCWLYQKYTCKALEVSDSSQN